MVEAGLEALESVTNEWQTHLRCFISRLNARGSLLLLQYRSIISLINLIGREVSSVDVGGKLWLEWCADVAEPFKVNTSEELVFLDLLSTSTTKTILSVADKATCCISIWIVNA
jgi:hypothetical protein